MTFEMDIATKYSTDLFLQIKSIMEESTCIYIASCLFTAFAIYLAWRLTKATTRTNSNISEQNINDIPQSLDRESSDISHSDEANSQPEEEVQEEKSKHVKEKPIARCHPVKKEIPATKARAKKSKKSSGAAVDASPIEEIHPQRENIDPLEYASHIQSRVKKLQNRELWKGVESELTVDDKQKEREAQRQQLEAIFKLMETQKQRFGVDSMGDVEDQVKLYM